MPRAKGKRASVSAIITMVAVLSLLSAWIPSNSIFHSPTATHTGYIGVSYTGVYHYVDAQPLCSQTLPPCLVGSEVVFYLITQNATIRLVFYCGAGYCWNAGQLPFKDGDRIYVEGTLLRPSDWPTNNYQPNLRFFGDLYVFNYTTA